MNSKMTTKSQLSTTEPKNKTKNEPSKQLEQELFSSHINRDQIECYWWEGENGGKGTENKHKWSVQNRGIKNSMGNGEIIELTCMTHGHELRGDC